MPVKLIITDLDGTIIDEENKVPQLVSEAFHKARERGVPAVIATGRTLAESTYAQDSIGADHYSITMNGAFIYDHKLQITLDQQHIERSQAKRVIRLLESFDDVFFHAYGNNQPICSEKTFKLIHMGGSSPQVIEMFMETQKVVPDLIKHIDSLDLEINKFYITSQNLERLKLIKDYANSVKGLRCLQSMPKGIEIIPTTVDKRFAVELLCRHLNIDVTQTLLIGDSENDIGMLQLGGISVAMGNASDHVKQYADWIAPSNAQAGVAAAIEKFVLID